MTREKPCARLRALLILCTLSAVHYAHAEGPALTLVPPPGTYPDTVSVTIQSTPSETQPRYLFVQSSDSAPPSADSNWVTYRMPLTLSALPGERRAYSLYVSAGAGGQAGEYTYVIDRSTPEPPAASVPTGAYRGVLAIRLASKGSRIVYGLDGSIAKGGQTWSGEALLLPPRADPYRLEAYSQNDAGAKSAVETWSYLVLPAPEPPASIAVVSPVAGRFANPQSLCIRTEGFSWVRYSLDGGDPSSGGTDYTGPILIDRTGAVTVRVAAMPASTGGSAGSTPDAPAAPLETSIAYEVDPEAGDAIAAKGIPSGPTAGPVTLGLPSASPIAYTFEERPPSAGDPRYSAPIVIDAPAGGVEYLPFRFARVGQDGAFGTQYRYLVILDGRMPTEPEVTLSTGGDVLDRGSRIAIQGPPYAALHYTLDGSDPTAASPRYTEPFTPALADSSSGEMTVKSVAIAPNGSRSAIVARLFGYSTESPAAPEVSSESSAEGGTLLTIRNPPGTQVHYSLTLDGSVSARPTAGSPLAGSHLELSLPFGMDRLFTLRFVAVDRFGNLSPATEALRIDVDRLPPPPPHFVVADGSLVLEGQGRLFFNLSDDGVDPPMPGPGSSRYQLPIPLRLKAGVLTDYRVTAIAVDPAGNISDVAFSGPIYVDGRPPSLPALYGVADEGLYNHPASLRLAPDPTLRIHYTLSSDGTAPADPTEASPLLTGHLDFGGKPGQVIDYIMRLLPIRNDAPGPIQTLRFAVDRKAPTLDPPTGFSDGGVVTRAVTVVDAAADPDSSLYISVVRDGAPGDPLGPAGEPFGTSQTFDVAPGTKATFSFRLAARDRAGNTTELDHVYSFTIDKAPPAPPTAEGLPPGGVANTPITLVLKGDGSRIYYRMTDDGSVPAPPDPDSPRYSAPISLPGASGKATTYTLVAIAQGPGGNLSVAPALFRVTVDRTIPAVPPPPLVTFAPRHELATLSWPPVQGATLRFAVEPGAAGATPQAAASPQGTAPSSATAPDAAARQAASLPPPDASFQNYTGPIFAKVAAGESRLTVWYFAQSGAGNRSPIQRASFELASLSTPPFVEGVAQGGLYATATTITRAPGVGSDLLRYELATGAGEASPPEPAEVTGSSPLFPDKLRFDVPFGGSSEFAIRLRLFAGSGDRIGVDGGVLRFTIDRSPPPSPAIAGIVDTERYRTPQRLTLTAPAGDAIFYSVDRLGEATPHYERYTEPVALGMHQLPFEEDRISAYCVDKAGNRSIQNSAATIFFDRGVVYVDESGNDRGAGTSTDPYRSLARAIRAVEEGQQSGILLAAGSYRIESPVVSTRDLQIVGGLDRRTWSRSGGSQSTVLRPAASLPSDAPLLAVEGGTLVLDNLSIFDNRTAPESIRLSDGELRYEGGALTLEDGSTLGYPRGPAHGVLQTGGRLVLRNTRWTAAGEGNLVDSRAGTVTLEGATLEGTRSPDNTVLVSLERVADASISGGRLDPGAGRTTVGIRAIGSKLSLSDTTVASGSGAISSIALSLFSSTLDATGASIAGDAGARIAFGIQAQASTIALDRTTLSVRGRDGAVGLFLDGGTATISASTVRPTATREFLYPVRMIDAKALIANTLLLPGDSSDVVTLSTTRSSLRFLNNTLLAGRGTDRSIGILAEEEKALLIGNSIILGPGAGTSPRAAGGPQPAAASAIVVTGPLPPSGVEPDGGVSIVANDFFGWDDLLTLAGSRYRSVDSLNEAVPSESSLRSKDNLSEQPAKTFRGSDDYRLQPTSACVGGGADLTTSGAPQTDRSGASLPSGSGAAFSIGAYFAP